MNKILEFLFHDHVAKSLSRSGNYTFYLNLPRDAKILAAQTPEGKPRLWAMVNPFHQFITRTFLLVETGDPILHPPENLVFIGALQGLEGKLVTHLFEVVLKPSHG